MSGKARAALVCAVTTVVLLNAQTKSAQTKPAQRAASLYEEVKVTARRVLLRRLLTCGNALYAYTGMDEGSPDQRTKIDVRVPRDTLGEYRGVLEGITPYGNGGDNLPLSDRLNGLQWSGRIDIINGPAVRKRARVNGAWGQWSEWTSEDGNAF